MRLRPDIPYKVLKTTIAMQIKCARVAAKLSQAKLANELGMNSQRISNYETARTLPSLKTLFDLAEFFEISLDTLCGRKDSDNGQ